MKRIKVELTEHSARRPGHHMLTVVQLPDVLAHVCASDTGMTLNVHVVTQRQKHLQKRGSDIISDTQG